MPLVSTEETLSTSIDRASPAATDINILTSANNHSGLVYVGVKIGYDKINIGKGVRENFLFIKENDVGKERKKLSKA